ncbi:MAG: hypothetical protein PF450_14290 [Bacteroidales bacterium]|nr:hypothetical protein [Bacteroidales bacterium]
MSSEVKPQAGGNSYTCLFYNLENMFHPSNDSLESDDDFTPEGVRRWTFYRYYKKLTQISKVILAANDWDSPTLICFCELENRQVLEDLLSHPLLMKNSYNILHRDSPDHRGMDVAILYRDDILKCIDTTWLSTKDNHGLLIKTREILCAKFVANTDTFIVATNHWTSKYGGALETESKRISQALTLSRYIDSTIKTQAGLFFITGGDFNDASRSKSLETLVQSANMTEIVTNNEDATYKYQGKWESIDHVFIGGELSSNRCKLKVLKNPFLLENDEKYTGMMPYRTYRGFAFNGGVSDHLPLILEFDPERH